MAAEIDGIERFPRADKLCAYAGLAPTTHASGGHVHHGRMLPFANRWLTWAFSEKAVAFMRAVEGRAADSAREARANVITNYRFREGALRGFNLENAVEPLIFTDEH